MPVDRAPNFSSCFVQVPVCTPSRQTYRPHRPMEVCYYVGHDDELYDLVKDSTESTNLASDPDHRETVRSMKDALLDRLITADETDQIAQRWRV